MKFIDQLKKKFIKNEKKKEKIEKEKIKDIPKEILDKLPPGVKIKRIEIGPKQIIKFLIYLVLSYFILLTLFDLLVPQSLSQVSLSQVISEVKKENVEKIIVSSDQIIATLKGGEKILVSSKENTSSLSEILQREGIELSTINLEVNNREGWKIFGEIFTLLLTIGLPLFFILWLFRKQSGAGGAGGVFGFGKSTAKLFIKGKQSLTFKDVAGVEEAKNDLVEVVDFLKHPEKYQKMGARAPKGVLLVGPSGVGKTLLAKAVAGEAGVPFYSMAGSEFMEMLVGVGASRVRDLFGTAKKAGKAIIFIDEIDAIGRVRGGMESHGEREQTLNQILVEMDGFEVNSAVVVLAATNRGDLLDPALLRPGRFDRRVVLELPDLEARKEILKIHAKGKPFEDKVEWELIAKATVGFSGAELENMLNEAAIGAARANNSKISMKDIDDASLKVKLGAEKKRVQSDDDKLITAYHEAGHAIVNYEAKLDPVSKISIISRGAALGFTLIPPQKDVIHHTKSKLIKKMAMTMGGRAAEEIVFKDISTGASSDISYATNIARKMVVEWGMSELGPVNLGPQVDIDDFGKAFMEAAKISDKMQGKVDEKIKEFVELAYIEAKESLNKNRKKLDIVAKVLAEKESLDQKEFEELMK